MPVLELVELVVAPVVQGPQRRFRRATAAGVTVGSDVGGWSTRTGTISARRATVHNPVRGGRQRPRNRARRSDGRRPLGAAARAARPWRRRSSTRSCPWRSTRPRSCPAMTLSASDYLYTAAPWSAERPPTSEAFGSNFELVDSVVQFQPYLRYSRERLPDAPLWNPYVGSGRPFVANAQSASCSRRSASRPTSWASGGRWAWPPRSRSSSRPSGPTCSAAHWGCASAARCWRGSSSPSACSSSSGSRGRTRACGRSCPGCCC